MFNKKIANRQRERIFKHAPPHLTTINHPRSVKNKAFSNKQKNSRLLRIVQGIRDAEILSVSRLKT